MTGKWDRIVECSFHLALTLFVVIMSATILSHQRDHDILIRRIQRVTDRLEQRRQDKEGDAEVIQQLQLQVQDLQNRMGAVEKTK